MHARYGRYRKLADVRKRQAKTDHAAGDERLSSYSKFDFEDGREKEREQDEEEEEASSSAESLDWAELNSLPHFDGTW
jgi:hypothetical protein